MNKTIKKYVAIIISLVLIYNSFIFTFANDFIDNYTTNIIATPSTAIEVVVERELLQKDAITIISTGTCGTNANYSLDDTGCLTIVGTGAVDKLNNDIHGKVKTIKISDGITSIKNGVFYNYYNLTSINFPNTLTELGGSIFDSTYALTSITLPNNLEVINDWTFSGMALSEFTEEGGCKYIGSANNPYLVLYKVIDSNCTDIIISDGTRFINKEAFCNCFNLNSITIPDTITYIGGSAFCNCTNLVDIIYEGTESSFSNITNIGNSITPTIYTGNHIHDYKEVIEKATPEYDGYYTKACIECNKDLISYTIPQIGNVYADSISFISNGKKQQPSIEVYDINNNLISSNNYSIKFTGDCKSAGEQYFAITFTGNYAGIINSYYTIEPFKFSADNKCGDNILFDYNDGILRLEGTGKMYDYTFNTSPDGLRNDPEAYTTPWYNNRSYITEIIIGEGITSIGDFAFFDYPNLEKVILPNTLESIGYYAFYNNINLTTIEFPATLNEVKNFAFYGCSALNNSSIPINLIYNDCAFDFEGDNKNAITVSNTRMNAILNYLNIVYLHSNTELAFDLYSITDGDKAVFQNIVDDIINSCNSDSEKIDAIGNFVSTNLTYDADVYSDNTNDVLRHLKGVCAGHNQFIATLFKLAGFPTAVISGEKNPGSTYKYLREHPLNHQWVMVYYDNSWHVVDATNGYYNNTTDNAVGLYVGLLVDGVLPVTETEDIYTYQLLKPFTKIYINNKFESKYNFNGFNFWAVDSIINNGAIWASAEKSSNKLYTRNVKLKDDSTFIYTNIKENGLKIVDVNSSINNEYYFWDQTGGIKVSKEFAYKAYYEGKLTVIKNDTFPILNNIDTTITIKTTDPSIAIVEDSNIFKGLSAGNTTIVFMKDNIEIYYVPVLVVDTANEISTNTLIQDHCKHEFICNSYCTYCGKHIEEAATTVIDTTTNTAQETVANIDSSKSESISTKSTGTTATTSTKTIETKKVETATKTSTISILVNLSCKSFRNFILNSFKSTKAKKFSFGF